MRRNLVLIGAFGFELCSVSAGAQDISQLQIQAEAVNYASLSNFSLGSRRVKDGTELPELTFEVNILEPPPCKNLVVYFDLISPSGAMLASDLMAAGTVDELRNVQQGNTYVAHIVSRKLTDAGSIIIRPACSSIY